MKERPSATPGCRFQCRCPISPDRCVPRLRGKKFARFLKISGILDERFDTRVDDPPPANGLKEGRKVAADGKPKRLCLPAGDVMRSKPLPYRFKTQPMQRARRQGRELQGIEPRRRARNLAKIEARYKFIEASNRVKLAGRTGQYCRSRNGKRFDSFLAQTPNRERARAF